MKRVAAALILVLAVALSACSNSAPPSDSTSAVEGSVVVSAASSLTDAFTALAQQFEADHPGARVDLNFGSSSSLATQIAEGAPAGVFASANEKQMQVVVDAGAAHTPAVFARNRIVIAAPAGNARVQSFEDLAGDGVRLVLAGHDVPVGDYARQAIDAAGAAGGYGADFPTRVTANVVSEEANVRAVLTKVELGEADAGIVYATDAQISGDAVRVVPIPDEFAPPAVYPIALVGDAPSEVARAFVDFVLSPAGQSTLASFGFSPPEATR